MGPWGRLVENLSSKLAFFPPDPPTYEVAEHRDATGDIYVRPLVPGIPKVLQCTVKKVKTVPIKGLGGGQEIVTAFVPYKLGSGSLARWTILYSHGNAVDLGQMLPVYREISKLLKVNVMGYDYSGYGCSTGLPTVNNTLADVAAVLGLLASDFNIPASQVILYGQSVGSGPTAWLGARTADIAGVVMHSPILSGVRVLSPNLKWWPAFADIYPNHLLVPKIKAPVLVMHGTEDEVIHISCGQKLYELSKNKYPPLWAHGFNHQNLETSADYLPTLERFLAKLSSSA